jgi:hypothetical protein
MDLWKAGSRERLAWSSWAAALHKSRALSTGLFGLAVGAVGKMGRLIVPVGRFSKSPELHSQNLENWLAGQPVLPESLRKDFHFSCLTTGITVLLFNLSTLFLLSVAFHLRSIAAGLARPLSQARQGSAETSGEEANGALEHGIQK